MKRAVIVLGALAVVLALLVLAAGRRAHQRDLELAEVETYPIPSATAGSASEAHQGFLYGRITTVDGTTYEGRLRFGGSEEAFWGDYFNGYKDENPWADLAPAEELMESDPLEVFGFKIADREREIDLSRPFMSRFGDIRRIEAQGRNLRVTLKNGSVFDLNRLNADDLADGLRVWDANHGVVDLHERRIHTVEFLPSAHLGAVAERLHGTVRTPLGDFTGFVQWNRRASLGSDEIGGRTSDGEQSFRFDTVRSIARDSPASCRVTLLDGREIVLSGTPEAGDGNRGIYVDDSRYGRVLVSWDAFERLDFSPGGRGPAFDDFPPGRALEGSVTTRAGRTLSGRVVFDLDESETTETLDAPAQGVNYTIPFGMIASIAPGSPEEPGNQSASVTLHTGETLQLESTGDLSETNGGLLVFGDGNERPEYVPWRDVGRIDFDRPPAE